MAVNSIAAKAGLLVNDFLIERSLTESEFNRKSNAEHNLTAGKNLTDSCSQHR